jgi:TetR/AcrR family transcriptional regulator
LRDEVLVAARTEFAQHGLAGARIDRIAKSAHASKERLYAHFGNKETLFREVVAADIAEFFDALTPRPDAVAEWVGNLYDLMCARPEHLRMMTWSRLEGFVLDEPHVGASGATGYEPDGEPIPAQAIAAIETAQADGHVDRAWQPLDLLVTLFGIGLAWAHWPDPRAITDDPTLVAHRRTVVVEAAARVIATPA